MEVDSAPQPQPQLHPPTAPQQQSQHPQHSQHPQRPQHPPHPQHSPHLHQHSQLSHHQHQQHQSPYSPKLPHVVSKPTLPPPSTQSPREPLIHAPPHSHSRRPSAAGVKEGLVPVQSPHHAVLPSNGVHQTNGQYYPSQHQHQPQHQAQPQQQSHPETIMDNLSRVQTVTSYNQASLEAQHRRIDSQAKDIERLEGMVGRIQQEMRSFQETLERLSTQLRHLPANSALTPVATPAGATDDTLELFAKNLTTMSAKVQEIEGVKMQVEIVKRRVNRIEASSGPPMSAAPYESPRDGPVHPVSVVHATPAATVPKLATPIRPELRSVSGPTLYSQPHYSPATEPAHAVEHDPQPPAWAAVNSSVKRAYPNGVEDRIDTPGYAPGSPKRPKLAPLEPHVSMESRPHTTYERMDTDEDHPRIHSRESYGEPAPSATATTTATATATTTPTSYVQYQPPAPVHAEDNWHQESQRSIEQRSPRRGRGGGRVGRPRKSMPADFEMGTPEWEKTEWSNTQVGPDGYYQPVTPGGAAKRGSSLVRRGSGGGGHAGVRAMTAELDPNHPSHDPYAHTKKTRTKPTRNADGILIRKDGRPDMRSHSSAANLRKVHARKEQERALEHVGLDTPTGSAPAESDSGDTPNGSPRDDGDTDPSTQDRHAAIMKQMFPNGVEDSRERMSYANRLFPAVNSPSHPPALVKAEARSPLDGTATPDNVRESGGSASAPSEYRTQERSPSAPPANTGSPAVEQK